jgi:signal transduction histidine kinase
LTISAENAPIDADRAEVLELDGGDYICLSVIDTGCGIPEDLLEHVY